MKHIHKYIFATILLFLLTSTVQSAPKAFDSLGNKLEDLHNSCRLYVKSSFIPSEIKEKCKNYNMIVDKAFKYGYQFDPYIESDKEIDEKKLDKYFKLMLQAGEMREPLLYKIKRCAKVAKADKNYRLFSVITQRDIINLHTEDYAFMDKNSTAFLDNERYIVYIEHKEKLASDAKL